MHISTRRQRLLKTLISEIASGSHRGKFYSCRRIGRIWPVSRPTVEAATTRLRELQLIESNGPRSLRVPKGADERARNILRQPGWKAVRPLPHRVSPASSSASQSPDPRGHHPIDQQAPLYEHLIKTLLIELASGAHSEGQRFLSRRKIEDIWKVSATTAMNATKHLLAYGAIAKKSPHLFHVCKGAMETARLLLDGSRLPALPAREDWLRKRSRLSQRRRTEGWKISAILDESRIYWESIENLPVTWTLEDSHKHVNAQWYFFNFVKEVNRHFGSVVPYLHDGTEQSAQTIVRQIQESATDGVAIFSSKNPKPRRPLLQALKRFGLPVINVLSDCEGEADLSIDFNEPAGGHEAMRILLDHGHRDILFFNRLTLGFPFETQRINGALACIREMGMEKDVRLRHLDFSPGKRPQRAMAKMLAAATDRPTAAIFRDPALFLTAEQGLAQSGIRIPGDLSVIAFGSVMLQPTLYRSPDLMLRNFARIGQTAARALIKIIGNQPLERTLQLPIEYLRNGTVRQRRTARGHSRPPRPSQPRGTRR